MSRKICVMVAALALSACRDSPPGLSWKYETDRPFLAGDSEMYQPVIVGDLVILCGGYGWDRQGRIAALDVADGSNRWEHVVGWCQSPPLVVESTAIAFASLADRKVFRAIDIATGALLWEQSLTPLARTPIAHGGWLYALAGDTLLRIAPRTGTTQRTSLAACDSRRAVRPWLAADDTRALLGCGAIVYSLDPQQETPVPLTRLFEVARSTEFATVAGDVLYIADQGIPASKEPGSLAAFKISDGRILWKKYWRKVLNSALVTDDALYINVSAPDWALLSLDPLTGEERWRSGVRSFNAPRVAGDRLYATDGRAVAILDRQTGAVLDRYTTSGEVSTTPVIAGNKLLFGNLKGVLYAIDLPAGEKR